MSLLPEKFYLDDFFDDFVPMPKMPKNEMKCDIYEKENKYYVEMDLPGFKKDEIKIECNKGNLVISAEKCEKDDEEDNERNYLRRERVYNKYSRSFYLGDVAEEEISAKFSDGTLTVVVPKKQEVETKKYIDIE